MPLPQRRRSGPGASSRAPLDARAHSDRCRSRHPGGRWQCTLAPRRSRSRTGGQRKPQQEPRRRRAPMRGLPRRDVEILRAKPAGRFGDALVTGGHAARRGRVDGDEQRVFLHQGQDLQERGDRQAQRDDGGAERGADPAGAGEGIVARRGELVDHGANPVPDGEAGVLRRGPCGGRLGRSGAGRGCHVGVLFMVSPLAPVTGCGSSLLAVRIGRSADRASVDVATAASAVRRLVG